LKRLGINGLQRGILRCEAGRGGRRGGWQRGRRLACGWAARQRYRHADGDPGNARAWYVLRPRKEHRRHTRLSQPKPNLSPPAGSAFELIQTLTRNSYLNAWLQRASVGLCWIRCLSSIDARWRPLATTGVSRLCCVRSAYPVAPGIAILDAIGQRLGNHSIKSEEAPTQPEVRTRLRTTSLAFAWQSLCWRACSCRPRPLRVAYSLWSGYLWASHLAYSA